MINLKFEAKGQQLKRIDSNSIVAFARNELYAEFVTDDKWKDKELLTAQFINGNKAYDVFLEDGRCLIPWEVLQDRGILKVCLIGGDLLTTNTVDISVLSTGVIGGLIPTKSSPTVYKHIMELADEIENRVNEIAKGDFSDMDVKVGRLYFRNNNNEDYAVVDINSEAGIRILNNINKNSDWFIKIGDGKATGEIDNGIQFKNTGEFIVKNKDNNIIRLTQKRGAENVIRGNENLKIYGGEGLIDFDSESAGITYNKAEWNENFKQLNINLEKGVNIQAQNNSCFISGEKKLVVGNDFNNVEFRTDGVAAFKDTINTKNLQINGVSVMDKVDKSIKEAEKNVSVWYTLRQLVRLGLGRQLFPVGTQLKCSHSEYGEIVWDVVAHNNNSDPTGVFNNSITLLSHNIVTNMQFDQIEALYYCENGLLSGTYSFKLMEGVSENQGGGKQYQFTLTKAVPVGGIIMFPWGYGKQAIDISISTYSSKSSVTPIETVIVTEGTEGTFLGTTDGNSANMNHSQRIRYGSGNWKESAIRQWLNSNKEQGKVWTPQTIFDRPAEWANNVNGFMYGLEEGFIDVVGEIDNITITNDIYECDSNICSFDTTRDKFWMPSITEIYNIVDGSIAQGSQFEYFADTENTAKIKYNSLGEADKWWLRSPKKEEASRTRVIYNNGVYSLDNSVMTFGIVIGCTIY